VPAADRPAHLRPAAPYDEISARLGIPGAASGPPAADALDSYASTGRSERFINAKPRRRDDITGNALAR